MHKLFIKHSICCKYQQSISQNPRSILFINVSITLDNNCLFSSIFINKKHLSLLPIPVSAEKLGLPPDEESIFDLLDKKKILDEKLCAEQRR